MAEKSPFVPSKLDVTLRIIVATVGTLPMSALLLSLISRVLANGSPLAEALVTVLLLPVWLLAFSICIVAERGTRLTAWVVGTTAVTALLLRLL